MGNFSSLQIALSGLRAFTRANEVVGENIANVSNPAFKRREIVYEPLNQFSFAGSGVAISSIKRAIDYFAEKDLRSAISEDEKNKYLLSALPGIYEDVSSLSESGIYACFENFWAALQDLSADPQDISLRKIAIERGADLCSALNFAIEKSDTQSLRIYQSSQEYVETVNGKLKEIAELNKKIKENQASGFEVEDLKDRRDYILEEISQYLNLDVMENDEGYTVSIDGKTLVYGSIFKEIKVENLNSGDLMFTIPEYNCPVNIYSGRLYGCKIAMNENYNLQKSLKAIADSIASSGEKSFNKIHREGYDLYGNISQTDFFLIDAYGRVSVNQALISDPKKLAVASSTGVSDGSNAVKLSDFLKGDALDGESYFSYISSLSASWGFKLDNVRNNSYSSESIKTAALNRRDSISGISSDEETVKLLDIQRSYAAMAKYLNSSIKMVEELIEAVG